MWERALPAIYHFQKGWMIRSFSGILPVVFFPKAKNWKSDGSFQKFGYFGWLISNYLFLPPKN
jgi:hypothetical protein